MTEVALLKADPFAFYARAILKLNPLDALDADPTGGDRGQVVHRILERWVREPALQDMGLEALVDAELRQLGDRPDIAALWRRRVVRMAQFAVSEMAKKPEWQPTVVEAKARWAIAGVILTGIPDRIDSGPDGYRVVDYKTGAPPGPGKVKDLFDPQLALLALMAEAGAFEGLPPGIVAELEYVKLSGGNDTDYVRPALGKKPADLRAHLDDVRTDFTALVGRYLLGDAAFTAKLHPVYSSASKDYDHLARLAEWVQR